MKIITIKVRFKVSSRGVGSGRWRFAHAHKQLSLSLSRALFSSPRRVSILRDSLKGPLTTGRLDVLMRVDSMEILAEEIPMNETGIVVCSG